MPQRIALALVAVALATAGCESLHPVDNFGPINKALADSLGDESVHNAIIKQAALYPYHFVANGAELNELGRRDLDVLIDHFRKYPGRLTIRRGSEGEAIYKARTETVLGAMLTAEVEAQKVTIDDGTPGGDGLASEEVIGILHPQQQPAPTWAGTKPIIAPGAKP